MPDYSDFRVYKEVEMYTDEFILNEFTEYTPDMLYNIFKDLVEKAEENGLEGCFLKFNSRTEPYENYLTSPSVIPCGYRKFNMEERLQIVMDDEINQLAKEMGIPVYEAKTVYKLKKEGKL